MFNPRTLKVIEISMKIYSSLGSNPYKWKSECGSFSASTTVTRKFTFFIAVSHTFFLLCFLIWRLVQHTQKLESNRSFQAIVWLWIWIILMSWSLVTLYNGWTKKWEIVALFNGVRLLTANLEREYPAATMRRVLWKFNIIDVHFIAVIWIVLMYAVAVTLMFSVVPARQQYFYSLISSSKPDKMDVIFLTFLIFEAYAKTSQVFMMGTEAFSILPTLLPTAFWMDYFRRIGRNTAPISEKISIFQKFHLLITYYNHAFVTLLPPMLSVLNPTALCVTCCFAAIRFRSFLPIFEYIPFPIIFNNELVVIVVTLLPAAAVYDVSDKLRRHIRNEVNSGSGKVSRKRLATLHAFGVRIGPIRKVRKIAILMCYNLIANYIFTLLITFPQEKVSR
ncbi:hypothetical protein Fcan01_20658 [Folsomia candida]|uniref:Uncharacterized protein n=1 Tax=Folsomia candida TaxID=158441 RepID=A0A226DKT4_FOLCA|nr:hypothetical protein Fcan01_20658 [Folsomia candida]